MKPRHESVGAVQQVTEKLSIRTHVAADQELLGFWEDLLISVRQL